MELNPRRTIKEKIAKETERIAVNDMMLFLVDKMLESAKEDEHPLDKEIEVAAELGRLSSDMDLKYLRGLLDLQKKHYPEDYDSYNERFFAPEGISGF